MNNQQGQKRNSNVHQTNKQKSKNNPSEMEQQLKRELTDGSVRLSEGKLVGRVVVEIEVETLSVFLNKVQQQTDGTLCLQEKDLMEKEISGLKAQLAQTNQENSSEDVKDLKSQLETLSERLCSMQTNLGQQTSYSSSLLQETEALKKGLLEKEEEWKEKESNMTSLMEKIGGYEAQLMVQKKEMNTIKAALQQAECQSDTDRIRWQEEKSSLLQDTEALKKTLLKKEQEWEEKETALNTQLDNTERSRSEAQLEEQKQLNTLTAALKEAQQQVETNRVHWEEDRSSHLQETENLKKDLLRNQQEWEEKERVMTSQLVELQAQIQKKKKKKKWYRRFF